MTVNVTVINDHGEIDIEGGYPDLSAAIAEYLTAPFEDDASSLLREPVLFRDGDTRHVLATGTYYQEGSDLLLRVFTVGTGDLQTHRCTATFSAERVA